MGYIFSMAEYQREYARDLQAASRQLIFHLLYMCFYPSNIAYSHWKSESYGLLPAELRPFKGKHRFPNRKFLFHNLYDHIHDSDGLPKNFKHEVQKKGLMVPYTFDMVYWDLIKKIGGIISDVVDILVEDHAITDDEYYSVLGKYGL